MWVTRFRCPLCSCLWFVTVAMLPGTWGCGSRDYRDSLPLVPVHGTVIYKGKPISSGQVVFLPEKDTVGVTTTGLVGNDGAYKMETSGREGAMLGWNRVVVRPYAQASRKPTGAQPTRIPEKYTWADQTPLRFEVRADKNEYLIVLE